jgi:AraC-like DNA-binding protein
MGILYTALHSFAAVLAILAAALLLWVNQERKHSNRILAAILLMLALQDITFLLLFTGKIVLAPWMLRLPAPTTFLVGPLAYLYVRSILLEETGFRKWDGLFCIPAVLTIINFLPYYILPTSEKIAYLNSHFYGRSTRQDPGSGILPSSIYYIMRIVWSGAFAFLALRTIYQFRSRQPKTLLENNKIVLDWLTHFMVLLLALWVAVVGRLIVPVVKDSQFSLADLLLSATILFTCLQLFFRPRILYGVYQPVAVALDIQDHASGDDPSSNLLPFREPSQDQNTHGDTISLVPDTMGRLAEQLRLRKAVDLLFQEKKPFLQADYSLEKLVQDTKTPRYVLSAFINREFGMGFREFINRQRIEYLKEHANNPVWKNFTMEAIGRECGFANRITFIKNLRLFTGQTPTEFFKERGHDMGSSDNGQG